MVSQCVWRIEIIASKLAEVFFNIYKNAIEQIESVNIKNPTIKTTFIQEDEKIIIEICDNAGGIDENMKGRIFEPYFSTKSKNRSGLGLYISQNIVQSVLNGDIKVYNKEKGACFAISFDKQLQVTTL